MPAIVMVYGCSTGRMAGEGIGAAKVRTLLFTVSCVLMAGCGRLGPATIPNDQVDYADAISRGVRGWRF